MARAVPPPLPSLTGISSRTSNRPDWGVRIASSVHFSVEERPISANASGRRSAEAGCRSARRSYLPGRERSERSGRSRSRGVGRCRFVEDAVRSDATPARSRCWPEVRGGIAFARKLCAAGSLRSVPRPWSPLPSPGRSGRTFPGCPGQVSPAVTWLPASGSSGDSI